MCTVRDAESSDLKGRHRHGKAPTVKEHEQQTHLFASSLQLPYPHQALVTTLPEQPAGGSANTSLASRSPRRHSPCPKRRNSRKTNMRHIRFFSKRSLKSDLKPMHKLQVGTRRCRARSLAYMRTTCASPNAEAELCYPCYSTSCCGANAA
jgi:hypothetical protein